MQAERLGRELEEELQEVRLEHKGSLFSVWLLSLPLVLMLLHSLILEYRE